MEAMKFSKLKRHSYSKHPQHAGNNPSFFQHNKVGLQRRKLEPRSCFEQENKDLAEAFYESAFKISYRTFIQNPLFLKIDGIRHYLREAKKLGKLKIWETLIRKI